MFRGMIVAAFMKEDESIRSSAALDFSIRGTKLDAVKIEIWSAPAPSLHYLSPIHSTNGVRVHAHRARRPHSPVCTLSPSPISCYSLSTLQATTHQTHIRGTDAHSHASALATAYHDSQLGTHCIQ
jgi:hypothetical protein